MITARSLRKTFSTRSGTVEAVADVDLDVANGEIVGFLGPNGAGKTTTLRMLTTLLEPTAGHATVAGHDLLADPVGVRRAIGYVAQGQASEPEATVTEEMVTQARMYGLTRRDAARRSAGLLDRLDLGGFGDRLVKTLSGGQRRRLEVALGLVHSPQLVFLDEPSTGLDPQSRANLWQHIRDLRVDDGLTVFLTTHYLDEADALCDRVIVIDGGRIVGTGTPAELKHQTMPDQVSFDIDDDLVARARTLLKRQPGLQDLKVDAGSVRFGITDADGTGITGLLVALHADRIEVHNLQVRSATLDDVFLAMTGRSLRDTGAATMTAEVAA